MKKLLIALDYDPTAQKVAETGHLLAKSMGAETMLLHVVSNDVKYSSSDYSTSMNFFGHKEISQVNLDSVEGLKKTSQLFLDKAKRHLCDDTIITIIKVGDFSESLLETAKDKEADIIIMGSHSRKWLENISRGSVTEEVLHDTHIPLFIVPITKQD